MKKVAFIKSTYSKIIFVACSVLIILSLGYSSFLLHQKLQPALQSVSQTLPANSPLLPEDSHLLLMEKWNTLTAPNFAGQHISLNQFDLNTQQTQELINVHACFLAPSLSPDKRKIAYLIINDERCSQGGYNNYYGGYATLEVLDLATHTEDVISSHVWQYQVPVWSGDGKYLTYLDVVETRPIREYQIHVYDMVNRQPIFSDPNHQYFSVQKNFAALVGITDYAIYLTDGESLYKITFQGKVSQIYAANSLDWDSTYILSPQGKNILAIQVNSYERNTNSRQQWMIHAINPQTDTVKEILHKYEPNNLEMILRLDTDFVFSSQDENTLIYSIDPMKREIFKFSLGNGQKQALFTFPTRKEPWFLDNFQVSGDGNKLLLEGSTQESPIRFYSIWNLLTKKNTPLPNMNYNSDRSDEENNKLRQQIISWLD